MTTLYIMCGLAFSGKSTLAKRIAEYTGSKLISFDKLWVEKDREKPVPEGVAGWQYIRRVVQDEITTSLSEIMSVVYDDNNIRFEHREELRNIARRLNSKFVVVYLDTPIELIRRREEANRITGERHEVSAENFQKVLDQLQVPTEEENVIVYKPEDSIEDWLLKTREL